MWLTQAHSVTEAAPVPTHASGEGPAARPVHADTSSHLPPASELTRTQQRHFPSPSDALSICGFSSGALILHRSGDCAVFPATRPHMWCAASGPPAVCDPPNRVVALRMPPKGPSCCLLSPAGVGSPSGSLWILLSYLCLSRVVDLSFSCRLYAKI